MTPFASKVAFDAAAALGGGALGGGRPLRTAGALAFTSCCEYDASAMYASGRPSENGDGLDTTTVRTRW